MDGSSFVSAIYGGKRVMALTFVDSAEGILVLDHMKKTCCRRGRAASVHTDDVPKAATVTASGEWGGDANRTIRFVYLSLVQPDELKTLAYGIESVAPSC